MTEQNGKLFNRSDTMLGVCQGLGEDIGISPNWFRLAFAAVLFWNWEFALVLYAACGVLVFSLRWLMPDRANRAAAPADAVIDMTPLNDPAPVEIAKAA